MQSQNLEEKIIEFSPQATNDRQKQTIYLIVINIFKFG